MEIKKRIKIEIEESDIKKKFAISDSFVTCLNEDDPDNFCITKNISGIRLFVEDNPHKNIPLQNFSSNDAISLDDCYYIHNTAGKEIIKVTQKGEISTFAKMTYKAKVGKMMRTVLNGKGIVVMNGQKLILMDKRGIDFSSIIQLSDKYIDIASLGENGEFLAVALRNKPKVVIFKIRFDWEKRIKAVRFMELDLENWANGPLRQGLQGQSICGYRDTLCVNWLVQGSPNISYVFKLNFSMRKVLERTKMTLALANKIDVAYCCQIYKIPGCSKMVLCIIGSITSPRFCNFKIDFLMREFGHLEDLDRSVAGILDDRRAGTIWKLTRNRDELITIGDGELLCRIRFTFGD